MIRTTLSLFIAPLALAFSALPAFAQDAERLEQVVDAEHDSGAFMGAVLVAKGDEKLLDRGWGSADLEWNIDNTPLTKFRIGSVTKQFTSVSILLLGEQGKLDIDAPIATYLKDTPEAWSAITVRNLMRHTAGLPNVTSLEGFRQQKFLPTTQHELITMFRDLPLEFKPGTEFKYSNSGYVLLSRIVENVSEQSLADFYQENIFSPLGMRETGIDSHATILPKRAQGYFPGGNGLVNAEYVNMAIPAGAGALYSTTGDLLKWQQGLFGGEVLSDTGMQEYLTPSSLDAVRGDKYALGVIVEQDDTGTTYYHGGGIEGFNAWLSYDPDREITVAVLANLNGGSATKLGEQLMTVARGGEVVLADEREVAEVQMDFSEYEGVYALAPTFKITISVDEDGRLMAQATGQGANEIFAESEDKFFFKVVDAQIHFSRDDAGEVAALTLFQRGQEIPGAKE